MAREEIHISAEQIEQAQAHHAEVELQWENMQPFVQKMLADWRRINDQEMGETND